MRRIFVIFVTLMSICCLILRAHAAQGNAALRIVVIEGEDAVNVVQQKTANRATASGLVPTGKFTGNNGPASRC